MEQAQREVAAGVEVTYAVGAVAAEEGAVDSPRVPEGTASARTADTVNPTNWEPPAIPENAPNAVRP